MDSRSMKSHLRFIIVLLIIFYLIILAMALKPQAGGDYRSYYIERRPGLSPWYMKRLRSNPIKIGATYSHDSNHILYTPNWISTITQSNLASGSPGNIYFWIDDLHSFLHATCLIIEIDRQNIWDAKFSLNTTPLIENHANDHEAVFLPIEASSLSSGTNKLEIVVSSSDMSKRDDEISASTLGVRSFRIDDSCPSI